ncbi:hypothetical protein ES703_107208 [subsurface metagenome]
MCTSVCSTLLYASKPTKRLFRATFTAAGTSLVSLSSDCRRRSLNKSPIATSSTPGELLTQLTISRVPCPPQPIKPIRSVSDPAANIRPVPDNKLAAPNPDKIGTDVLIKSLRETPSLFSFALLFMSNPFNKIYYYFIKNQSTVVIPAEPVLSRVEGAGIQIIDEIGFRIKCGMTSVQRNLTEH